MYVWRFLKDDTLQTNVTGPESWAAGLNFYAAAGNSGELVTSVSYD